MGCRAVPSSTGAIKALTLLMVFAHVCEANMILKINNKFENLSPEEMMIERWKHDQRTIGRSLSAVDINGGSELYPGIALFYAQVVLGDPPKAFYPQITPLMGMTWLYCNGCKRCPSESSFEFSINKYEVKDSSKGKIMECNDMMCDLVDGERKKKTCSDNFCNYRMEFEGGGITTGNMVEDVLRLNTVIENGQTSPVSAGFVFGCGMDQYEGLESSVFAFDGFMGTSMSNLSMLSQLTASKHVKKNSWSHCFKKNSKGGVLAFGQVQIPKKMKMTPLLPNVENYVATIVSFHVSEKSIPIEAEQLAIVDISNSYNYLTKTAYNAFFAVFKATFPNIKLTPANPFSCFLYSGRIDETFPILTYTFKDGAEMKIHPDQYIYERSPDEWCIAILNSENINFPQYFLITEFALAGRLVVYDVEDKLIGWTDYDCDKGIKILDDETGKAMVVRPHEIGHDEFSGRAMKLQGGELLFVLSIIFSYLCLISI